MSFLTRVRRFMDYDEVEARRVAARSAAVDRDIALAHAEVRAAVQSGATTLRGTVLLKPRDVDRVTRHVMAALRDVPTPEWPADDLIPPGEHGDIDAIRRAVN